ncbi:MAG: Crp/Fnr family transcriptional regulator [Pseudomonadota bacterium]
MQNIVGVDASAMDEDDKSTMPETSCGSNTALFCAQCSVRGRSICAMLDGQERKHLDKLVTSRSISAGSSIFGEGDESNHLYILTHGVVRLSKLLRDGRRQIIGFLFAGDFLGKQNAGEYACDAEAVTDTKLCSFSHPMLTRLSEAYPGIKDRLMAETTNELEQAQEHILLLGQKTAAERVASALLNFACRSTGQSESPLTFTLPVSRQDLADYLGLRIETVSRTLSRFRKSGLIRETSRTSMIIDDIDRLEDVASGDQFG